MHLVSACRTLFLAVGAAACLFAAEPAATVKSFTQLEDGEAIELSYFGHGCFHFQTYDLRIENKVASVVELRRVVVPQDSRLIFVTNAVFLGTVTLDRKDLAGLDRLIGYMRSPKDGICTTVDELRLTLLKNGEPVARELRVDRSCAV